MTDEQGHGLSRRDLIKRGAVIGGVVWAAPVVQGITSPAFAAENGTTLGGECTLYYQFKAEYLNGAWVPEIGGQLGNNDTKCPPLCVGEYCFGGLGEGVNKLEITGTDQSVTVCDAEELPDCEVIILAIKGGQYGVNDGGYCWGPESEASSSRCATVSTADIPPGETTESGATPSALSFVYGIICCEPVAS